MGGAIHAETDGGCTNNGGCSINNGGFDRRAAGTGIGAEHLPAVLDALMGSLAVEVGFQWKNLDFLVKNPDFLLRNPDFLLKNVGFII